MRIGKRTLLFFGFAVICAEGSQVEDDSPFEGDFRELGALQTPTEQVRKLREIYEKGLSSTEISESQRTTLNHRIKKEAAEREVNLALGLLEDYPNNICKFLPTKWQDVDQNKAFLEGLESWDDRKIVDATTVLEEYHALSYDSTKPDFKGLISDNQREALLEHKDTLAKAYYFIIPPDSEKKSAEHESFESLFEILLDIIVKAEGDVSLEYTVTHFSDEVVIVRDDQVTDAELLSNYLPGSPQSDPTIAHAILNDIMENLRPRLDTLASNADAKDLLARLYAVPMDERSNEVNSAIAELESKGVTVSSTKWVWRIGITLCALALLACGLYFALGQRPQAVESATIVVNPKAEV